MYTTLLMYLIIFLVGCVAFGGLRWAVKSNVSPENYSAIKFLFFSVAVLYFGFELGGYRTIFWVVLVWMAWMLGGVRDAEKADKVERLLTGDVERLLAAIPQLELLAGVGVGSVSPAAADAMTRLPKLGSRPFMSYGQEVLENKKKGFKPYAL